MLTNLQNDKKTTITPELMAQKRQEVLQDLIQEEVFWQEAKKYGISVSDGEVAADVSRYPAFVKDGHSTAWRTIAYCARSCA